MPLPRPDVVALHGRLTAVAAIVFVIASSATATAQVPTTGEAPAGVGPNTFTVTARALDVLTGPGDDIAITLDLDVYLPANATAATPAPAVIHTHGFGGNKGNGESVANASYLASKGYVVITHSTQGFGKSTGCIGLDSTDYDGRNIRSIVDLLATMPEVATNAPDDPRVGLLGGSYGGGLQGGAAWLDPRIDAIAIGRSWNALQYSLVPNNWVIDPAADMFDLIAHEQGVFKQQWTSLFFALGSSSPATGAGGCDPVNQQLLHGPTTPCLGFVPEICPIYAALTTTGDSLPGQREVIFKTSIEHYIDEIDTPTMVVQGLPDTLFTATEAAATYTAMRDRGVPTQMIWISSGHGGYFNAPGEAEAYTGQFADKPEEFANSYLPRRTLQWFDRHVRGVNVDTGPAFAWFRDWVTYDVAATGGTAAPAFGTASDFPDPSLPETTLFMSDGGSLVASTQDVADASLSLVNPPGGLPAAYTETANYSGPNSSPRDTRTPSDLPTQTITLATAPMAVDTELTGIPSATLQLAAQNPLVDARLFGKIHEVDADGTRTLLHRQVAASRIPASAWQAGPVTVLLPPVATLVEAGNHVEIVFASTDVSYYNERTANQLTVSSSAAAPTLVHLPLRAATAPLPAAPTPSAPAPAAPPSSLPATGGGLALAALALAGLASSRRRGH